jgi:outer membrane immunogenic protein
MKKTIIIYASVLLNILWSHTATYSQIQKGTWIVGGIVQMKGDNSEKNKTTATDVSPRIGYFLSENFAIGITTGFGSTSVVNKTAVADYSNDKSTFRTGIFARYYHSLGSNLYLAFEGTGVQYSSSSITENSPYSISGNITDNITESKQTRLDLGIFIKPHIGYLITPKIALEANIGSIGFGYYDSKITITASPKLPITINDNKSGTAWEFNLLTVGLGIQFYL